jgi:hypothetical protein
MPLRRALLLLLGTAAVLRAAAGAHAAATPPGGTITPNPSLQNEIARAAAADSEAELHASLAKLRAAGGPEFGDLIPQLVLYLMDAKDVRQAMIAGVIIDRLKISPAQIERALRPYRTTNDPRLRREIDNLLDGTAGGP